MAFSLVIQGPPAFLILAGIGFLIFSETDVTGWVLIGVGAILLIILTWISTPKKAVVVSQPQKEQ